ncbi:MAG: MGMT family protein [Dermatophilaceae bacterium]
MDEALVERVLSAVELIPAGQVVSYGDLGGLVGCGPRQVGSIMARFGGGVPWWRVVSSSGDVPAHLRAKARPTLGSARGSCGSPTVWGVGLRAIGRILWRSPGNAMHSGSPGLIREPALSRG